MHSSHDNFNQLQSWMKKVCEIFTNPVWIYDISVSMAYKCILSWCYSEKANATRRGATAYVYLNMCVNLRVCFSQSLEYRESNCSSCRFSICWLQLPFLWTELQPINTEANTWKVLNWKECIPFLHTILKVSQLLLWKQGWQNIWLRFFF